MFRVFRKSSISRDKRCTRKTRIPCNLFAENWENVGWNEWNGNGGPVIRGEVVVVPGQRPIAFTHQQVNDRPPILQMRVSLPSEFNPCRADEQRDTRKKSPRVYPLLSQSYLLPSPSLCLSFSAKMEEEGSSDEKANAGKRGKGGWARRKRRAREGNREEAKQGAKREKERGGAPWPDQYTRPTP